MKIVFVLPSYSKNPVGGFKIVFEYANRFVQHGIDVTIVFDCKNVGMNHKLCPSIIKKLYSYFLVWKYPRWFQLDPRIHKVSAYHGITDKIIPNSDAICATAVSTAKEVASLSPEKGKKFYLIQGFENWGTWSEAAVKETYCLGMINIVVAKWLEQVVSRTGASCALIPNGIDFNVFNIDKPIVHRNQPIVSMLYHKQPQKGTKYGIQALQILKGKYPDLKAILFGVPLRPHDLPEWIDYVHKASPEQLRKIYNASSIYLSPSLEEGFGLTGAEAMACGAAYVSSDSGGVHEYTIEGRNVLLSPPKDVGGLVENVSYLIENDNERIRLAKNGYNDIQRLSLDYSVKKFEDLLKFNLSNRK